jgi:cell division protein FtsI (penicillin-binding protein 3)
MLGVTPDDTRDVDVSDILPTLWQDPSRAPTSGGQ